jgi:acyl-CoA synthetase (AMP-forming)/AMP-acid ligase II
MIGPLTVGRMLSAHARLQPEKIAARDLERAMTYRQWNARSCRLANALTGLGLRKGDRFAALAYNRVEWAEIYAAAAKAELVAVPINFRLTAPEARYIIEDCALSAILVEDALTGVIETIRGEFPLPDERYVLIGGTGAEKGYAAFEDLLARASDGEPDALVKPEDSWCLMYTSGTTGRPKGAIRDHLGMAMLAS